MKTGLVVLCCVLSLSGMAPTASGQVPTASGTSTEKIIRELIFEKKALNNTLMVLNINGDVKVEGYEGDKVMIEVEKTIKGKTQARLEQGKLEIDLGIID